MIQFARRAYPYWRRRSWRRAAMRVETDIGWHRRKKRQLFRRSLAERFQEVIPTSALVPPFVISGVQGPFEVPGPLQVYTSSTYFEAPTIVNDWTAWNIVKSRTENFPLFWNRMR